MTDRSRTSPGAGPIGLPIDRVDGRLKVTGRAAYARDHFPEADLAHGVIVLGTIGKGRVLTVETAPAEQAPGVLLVMTHRNAPRQAPFGPPVVEDRFARPKPQLDGDRVRYYGEPVALVVAETLEAARAGAGLVTVRYAEEAGAFDMDAERARAYEPEELVAGAKADSEVGDFEAALAEAPIRLDAEYLTPYQNHNPVEPQATLARWGRDRLTVYCATQMVDSARTSIAATLELPVEKVRVVSRYVGGGFGNKLPIYADTILAALAARRLRRPVKVALTHRQMFSVTTHRPRTAQRVRLGARADGTLVAIGHEVWSQTARFDEFAEPAALCTRSLYAAPARVTRHRLVPLDLPVSGSMRAPGEAVGLLAVEQAMDELAVRLGIDPIELRVRNEPTIDPERNVPFSTRALVPCLREGARRFGWARRHVEPGRVVDGAWRVGVGVAAAIRPNYLQEAAATVRLYPDGTAVARLDMTDIGTGTYTILTQVAAEALGLPIERVRVELGDSDFPTTPGSGGSYGATSCASALLDACRALRERLTDGARVPPEGLEADGAVEPGESSQRYSQHSFGAHFAEVGVDADTGEIRLRRMLGVFAAGRILNAKTARSQLIGGMIWGVGSALHERTALDIRDGSFVNRDLAEYHVPVHADVPDVDAVVLPEFDDKANPLGAKGIGELGICGAGAAVANAVFNACGVRIREYPITMDKILAGPSAGPGGAVAVTRLST